jgi:hypothetical protein
VDRRIFLIDSRLPLVYNINGVGMNAKELTLRVVPLDDVLLHEQIEKTRVERLVKRLEEDHLLKNPPIVSEYNGKFVLLDGATRITALKVIGCCDVVVQVVDYEAPGMILESWNHMLLDAPVDQLFTSLRAVPGLTIDPTSAASAGAALERRDAIATLLLADGQAYALRAADNGKLPQQAKLLNQVVAAYEGRGEMYRVAHTDVERLLAEHGRLSALVVFPRYRPDEIRLLALNGAKLPMGVTRHIIPGRALRINIPLDVLTRAEPIERKNAWLDEWMKTKMRERSVRFYQEPVFLFDE